MTWVLFDLKNRLKSSGVYIAFTLVIFISGFYAFLRSERGIRKYLYLRHEVEHARVLADQYKARKGLGLRKSGCCRRTVWIRFAGRKRRIVLNFVGSDEFVILDGQIGTAVPAAGQKAVLGVQQKEGCIFLFFCYIKLTFN